MQEIVSELSKTITRNGQRGVQRTFQALQAAISISTEYVTNFQQGIQEPPQVYLVPHILTRLTAGLTSNTVNGVLLCVLSFELGFPTSCVQVILRKLFEKLGATYVKLGEAQMNP